MPRSQQPLEGERAVIERVRILNPILLLDVGAGDGKWGSLLRPLQIPHTAAIEVWQPTAEKLAKARIYDDVLHMDARKFGAWACFTVILLGDVLEHMPRADAEKLIKEAGEYSTLLLTIPISLCVQDGNLLGNPYETHVEQWTHEQVLALGFRLLHRGFNQAGTVEIGTYERSPLP